MTLRNNTFCLPPNIWDDLASIATATGLSQAAIVKTMISNAKRELDAGKLVFEFPKQ